MVDWKKEIKLGKRASEPAPAAPEGEAPAAEEKVPFWKKEIGGGRKQKRRGPAAAGAARARSRGRGRAGGARAGRGL